MTYVITLSRFLTTYDTLLNTPLTYRNNVEPKLLLFHLAKVFSTGGESEELDFQVEISAVLQNMRCCWLK